jgi:hypothetical protein|tara:strand:+ start:193 stop:447 length:255 start_codon:yes stop_codon:yes gene_type:complete
MSENKEPKPTLTINDKEYFEADLNKNEARMLTMLKALQPEIESLDLQLGTRLDHKDRLIAALESSLEASGSEVEDAEIVTETKQ